MLKEQNTSEVMSVSIKDRENIIESLTEIKEKYHKIEHEKFQMHEEKVEMERKIVELTEKNVNAATQTDKNQSIINLIKLQLKEV